MYLEIALVVLAAIVRQSESVCQSTSYLSGSSGTIRNEGYSSSYYHNSRCGYQVTVPSGNYIRFTVQTYWIESCSSCSCDYLSIHDGSSTSYGQLMKTCSSSSSYTVTTSSNVGYVYFKTDTGGQGPSGTHGWSITYEAFIPPCTGTRYLSGRSSGYIQNDGYPNSYAHNQNCGWQVAVSSMKLVRFQLSVHSLQYGYDYVSIHDGPYSSSTQMVRTSSSGYSGTYTTTTNYGYVSFVTDSSVAYGGFQVYYEEVNLPACTSVRYVSGKTSGYIQNDAYPNYYSNNENCGWQVVVSSGKTIRFQLSVHSLEQNYDFVTIYDGPSTASVQLVKTSTNGFTGTYYTTSNYGFVTFVTNHAITAGGFRIYFEEVFVPWPNPSALIGIWPLDSRNVLRDVSPDHLNGYAESSSPVHVVGPYGDSGTGIRPYSSSSGVMQVDTSRFSALRSFTISFYFQGGDVASSVLELGSSVLELNYSPSRSTIDLKVQGSQIGSYAIVLRQGAWTFVALTYDQSTRELTVFTRHGPAYKPKRHDAILQALSSVSLSKLRLGYSSSNGYMATSSSVSCLSIYSDVLTVDDLFRLQQVCRYLHGSALSGSPRLSAFPVVPDLSNQSPQLSNHGQFPYAATLHFGKNFGCSAVIVDAYWLLTSSICFIETTKVSAFTVIVGQNDYKVENETHEVRHSVANLLIDNELALVELKTPIDFTNKYANDISVTQKSLVNQKLVFTGWGSNGRSASSSHSLPRYTVGETLRQADCDAAWNNITAPIHVYNSSSDVCFLSSGAAGVNVPCVKDEGGPLLRPYANKDIGEQLMLAGVYRVRNSNCTAEKPGVFSLIDVRANNWIREKIACAVPGISYPANCPQ